MKRGMFMFVYKLKDRKKNTYSRHGVNAVYVVVGPAGGQFVGVLLLLHMDRNQLSQTHIQYHFWYRAVQMIYEYVNSSCRNTFIFAALTTIRTVYHVHHVASINHLITSALSTMHIFYKPSRWKF